MLYLAFQLPIDGQLVGENGALNSRFHSKDMQLPFIYIGIGENGRARLTVALFIKVYGIMVETLMRETTNL